MLAMPTGECKQLCLQRVIHMFNYSFQAIFLKPIQHTLSVKCNDTHAKNVPYMMATQPVRIINDNYNALLANAGDPNFVAIIALRASQVVTFCSCLPSCMWIRQVKESWTKACVARMKDSSAAKEYTAACLGNHSDGTSNHQYGLHLDTVVQVH